MDNKSIYNIDELINTNKNINKEINSKFNEDDDKYDFPIKKSKAIEIACKIENLKSDYCKKVKEYITNLDFHDFKVEIIEQNGKKYYQINVIDGDISGMDGDICWDSILDSKTLKLLRCLIDVETGEYLYFPE